MNSQGSDFVLNISWQEQAAADVAALMAEECCCREIREEVHAEEQDFELHLQYIFDTEEDAHEFVRIVDNMNFDVKCKN